MNVGNRSCWRCGLHACASGRLDRLRHLRHGGGCSDGRSLCAMRVGGMGIGDTKLAAAVGLWLGVFGIPVSLVGFFLAFAFGAIQGLLVMAIKGAGRKQQLPFGPAILGGGATAIIFGNQIWFGYLQLVTGFAI